MAGTAIDDIFAGKDKRGSSGKSSKTASSVVAPTAAASGSKAKTSKSPAKNESDERGVKTKHGKVKSVEGKAIKGPKTSRKQKVETVVDPSKKVEEAARASARAAASSSSSSKGGSSKRLAAEDEEFRDTRGQNRRKTDDGLTIYSETELRLDSKGGDTPLCPFDCECCY